ncbi:zinc finger protein 462-like [Archocentrus centrarchus]|uniref:zinc finger protein 462-like n=1 Tax=Archocentrus centrarchus TaxID=63155 RepID=UPI0011E9C72B|nr:zinc finger protein 462-like [Archocentrus centrarchus]
MLKEECKMQNDTVQCSTSGHIKQVISQAVAQETPAKAFHCSQCVLIFKSKVYLFEHLNKVHGLDTETSLREAGLCSVTNKAGTENSSGSSGDNFKCQHCDFKAYSWDSLSEHEELCQKTSENLNVSGSLIISENLDTTLSVITTSQNSEAAGASESPSDLSDISTSETKCTSKDLKTYKRPLQTITKYFSVSSGSNTKAAAKLADGTRGTLILQESPSSSCSSGGVFKVTAKSVIDITASKSYHFLHSHLTTDLMPSKPQEQFKETVPAGAVKRSSIDISKSHPAKKAKLDDEETLMEKENESRQQSSSSNEFSFEVSEDEEDAEAPKVYSCKHCDYSDVGIRRVSAHYQNEHPYIRYSSVYIQDSSDQSATFRCLECPVEFLSTADLKRHYMENHPEAPDVITMKSYELSLVFRCFICTFTTNVLKSLKEHYKAKHATYEVENSLLFCRYSMTECPEESSRPSPERSGEIPPEHTHAAQNPTDVALYKCKKCTFSHKSVVVMHVHYQKWHPDEAITIDKIKQSACVTSRAAPEMRPEKYQDSLTPVDPSEITPEASMNHSEFSQTEKGESVESPTRCNNQITTRLANLSSSSPNEMFYCQFCSYTSTKIKSILGHHNAKHSMDAPIDTSDVLWYSVEMQKKKLQSEANMSKSTSCSQLETNKQVKMCRETEIQHEEDHAADASETGFYPCPENLFYCQKCNFANPTVKGVINHQAKIHRKCNSGSKCVLEHTALVRDEIRKAKSNAMDSSSRLPLPIMNEGDENAFFCHFCNYRHSTLDQVMRHYLKVHHGFKVNPSDVLLHTSKILDQTQKSSLKSTRNQEVAQEPLKKMDKKKKKLKKLAKSLLISAPPPATAPQTQRSLKCYRCTYSTEQVYALKTHIRKTHQVKRTVTDLLRLCFRQGALEPGYHCEFCTFKHEKAAAVYEHYQEHHSGRVPGLEYVSTRLYVGPGVVLSEKKKLKQKRSGGDGTSKRLLFQRSGQNETGLSCRKCSFKSNSLSDLAHHYRAVHPLGAKQDCVGLNTKKASTSWRVKDHSEPPDSFKSCQVPVKFDKSQDEAEASSIAYKCPHCSMNFTTQHGLHVHYGMKHPETLIGKLEQQKPQKQLQKRLHVFKCPYCTYVNTVYQGVLTHCQMKHPDAPSRADSLHVDMTHVQNLDDARKSSRPGESLKFSGHMCKTCPQICATLDKLNNHCEQDHNRLESGASTSQSTVKPTPKPLTKRTMLLSKVHSMHGSISKASFLSKKIYASISCQLCSYTCTTKFALGRHLLATHKHAISKDCVYKCVLCSNVYFRRKHLAGHYAVTHGKEAYLKYYVPVYKQKPSEVSSTRHQANATESFKSSITAEDSFLVYRCPKCPYVNASYHGTLTHCQMKHPAIVVRADELETGEVLASNMVGCSLGKGSNQRGYTCKKCAQIHASLTKLNAHCKRDHSETEVSEHSAETENQPAHTSQGSAQEDEAEEVSVAETRQAPHVKTPETCRSIPLAVWSNKTLYKCQMCTYKGLYRKYLQCHYKNTHKLDAVSAHKLLEKYNKRKWNFPRSLPKSEDKTNVKCLKCPNVTFDSSQLLIDHYSTFHRSEWKLDFTVLSLGSEKKKTTGVYKCIHCKTQLNGIRKMCYHMDRHRARTMEMAKAAQRKASSLVISATPEQESSEPCRPDEMPALQNVEEVNQWNGTPVQSAVVPTSPPQLPSKVSDVQQPELESNSHKHTCKQCGRMFMSLKGLRSHEHSHAALAAIKKLHNLPTSALKHNISKYVIHKSGTVKPFLCSCCTYRTTVFGLWRSHFMKKHQDLIMDAVETEDKVEESDERADKESNSSEKINSLPEFDEEPELVERSLYLEPPDVQRQLNHYTMMAQSSAKSKVNVQESKLPENSVLHCELCNFSTGHLSSIRRHYLNRHGKKILRCKDCSFFTGLRKTLEMHMETGHSTCQSEPTHQKDLRCPFCLYQTKNKNNMIDHIVLHREERVVPIEVRRPKLSRYLRGIVFRCHKCTFTSGSPENLRFHMMRHDDIKPYKCRLCYFDCTRLSDLEAHLSDKHQVVRNHELVGQVSLDQLEAKVGGASEAEEEHLSNMEQLVREDVEMFEFFTDCDEVPQAENPEDDTTEKTGLQIQEACGMRDQEGNEESPGESSELDIQQENAKANTTVQQDLQKRETAREEETGNVEQSVAEMKITESQFKDCNGPDEERQTNENQAQPKLLDCEDKEQKDTGKDPKGAENTPAQKQDVKALEHKTLNIEARVEDDIVRHILQLDDDGSKMHNKADQDRTVKTEKGVETSDPSDLPLAKESSFALSHNQKSHANNTQADSALTKINSTHVNNTRAKESFRIERHMLTLPPNYARLKMISGDVLGVSFAKFKREQVHAKESSEREPEPCREMPVLEKECLKKEVHPPGCFKEEEEKDPLEQKQSKESEMATEDENQLKDERFEDQDGMKEGDFLQERKDTVTPGAAEVLRASEHKRFTCEFCGRNLENSSELKRHVMRHGI